MTKILSAVAVAAAIALSSAPALAQQAGGRNAGMTTPQGGSAATGAMGDHRMVAVQKCRWVRTGSERTPSRCEPVREDNRMIPMPAGR